MLSSMYRGLKIRTQHTSGCRECGAGSVIRMPAAATGRRRRRRTTMLQRMDNVGIVVDDLKAATAFFIELGLELEGEMTTAFFIELGLELEVGDDSRGTRGGPRRRVGRCPKRHRNDADLGRPRPARADQVSRAAGYHR